MFALLVHAGVLYAVSLTAEGPAGGGGVGLEAISVEVDLVPAKALESRVKTADSAGTAAAVEHSLGVPELEPVHPVAVHEKTKQLAKNEQEPTPASHQSVEPFRTQKPAEEPFDGAKQRNEQEKETKTQEVAPAAAEGGAPSRAALPDPEAAGGAAIASPGAVLAYARRVQRALDRNKPKWSGLRGTARIVFEVRPDGSLAFVRILVSSGNARLDDLAAGAVRRTRLPIPPRHMSALQRTFVLPYKFR